MAMFKGFKPQGLQKIATKMGYAGRMEEFDRYLENNPEKQREMIVFQSKAQEMARGGVVRKMAVGGATITLQDSFNVTSMTDNGTGQIMMLFANDMVSVNYAVLVGGGQSNNIATIDTGTQAAGQVRLETFNVSEALVNTDTMAVIHGDLA